MRNGFGTVLTAVLWLGLAAPAVAQATWPVSGELTDGDSQNDERRYDDHPVHLESGQRYRISVNSDAFDPLARLYREGQVEPVAENDDGEGGLNSLIVYSPAETGEFRLRVTSFSAAGPRRLYRQRRSAGAAAAGRDVALVGLGEHRRWGGRRNHELRRNSGSP